MKLKLSLLLFVVTFLSSMAQARDWTLMVYLNGHNNLDEFGWDDINEMEKVGSSDRMTVIVQWASLKNSNTKRLKIEKDQSGNINSTVLQELPRIDMGDSRSLVEFVKWGMQHYPADHYLVDIWNHGGGWHRVEGFQVKPTDISWDDETGNSISTEELGEALEEIKNYLGRKIDILGMDACLMSMIEVASEIKSSVDYMASSQEVEPGAGWDYTGFLSAVNSSHVMTPTAIGTLLTDTYVSSYENGSQGKADVTFSLLDLSKVENLNIAISNLSNHWRGVGATANVELKKIVGKTLSFDLPDYIDLGDFIKLAQKSKNRDIQSSPLEEIEIPLAELVVYKRNSIAFSRASGVSIWMPMYKYQLDEYGERYQALDFNVQTHWMNVITKINSL